MSGGAEPDSAEPDCDALGPAKSMDAKLVEDPTDDCEAGDGGAR